MLHYQRVRHLAVLAERLGRADLVQTHESRVTGNIGCNYRCEPALDTSRFVLLGRQSQIPLPRLTFCTKAERGGKVLALE